MQGTDEVCVWGGEGSWTYAMNLINASSSLQNYTELENKLEQLQWLANNSHDVQST